MRGPKINYTTISTLSLSLNTILCRYDVTDKETNQMTMAMNFVFILLFVSLNIERVVVKYYVVARVKFISGNKTFDCLG